MRDIERFYFEYIFLGTPPKPFAFFFKFALKKQITPTVYAKNLPQCLKIFYRLRHAEISESISDSALLELLIRHASNSSQKKFVFVCSAEFESFKERNRHVLEKSFLIRCPNNIYDT